MTLEATPSDAGFVDALNTFAASFDLRETTGSDSLGAWFLGPLAENASLFEKLVVEAVQSACADRKHYYPDDPPYVTEEMKRSKEYLASVDVFKQAYHDLLGRLSGSVPFFSYRYQGHMNWDMTMPAMAGYFAAMLYNQNNVAAEASPVTTLLEMAVGNDLCEMLGYKVPAGNDPLTHPLRPWGHITCDGSVANIEAMWSARNLKYYPIALASAIKAETSLAKAKDITVQFGSSQHTLIDLDTWQLLNLPVDPVLDLPRRLREAPYEFGDSELDLVNRYSLPHLGYARFSERYLADIAPPAVLAPATMHYSWPKAATLLGIGEENLIPVEVDLDARVSAKKFQLALEQCRRDRRPVLLSVAVLGTTEESAVDPLTEILATRKKHVDDGFAYPVHVDAAWGGYFATILRTAKAEPRDGFVPLQPMSAYVNAQYAMLHEADSITVDPHKAGYVPYPAGALCYRNGEQRNLVTLTAPIVYHHGVDPTVGVYGVEGSKPGAAAAAVYLSHRVIRTDESGYGRILGQSIFNSKRFYAALVTMALEENCPYTITAFQRLPAERQHPNDPAKVVDQLKRIKHEIVPKKNEELVHDQKSMGLLKELGSDQIIIAYAFNFKKDGVLNQDIGKLNEFNDRIYRKLSVAPQQSLNTNGHQPKPPVIVTSSNFARKIYGDGFVDNFVRRILTPPGAQKPSTIPHADVVNFLLSTTMDPWMTSTAKGNFIPKLITEIDRTVREVVKEMTHGPKSVKTAAMTTAP